MWITICKATSGFVFADCEQMLFPPPNFDPLAIVPLIKILQFNFLFSFWNLPIDDVKYLILIKLCHLLIKWYNRHGTVEFFFN